MVDIDKAAKAAWRADDYAVLPAQHWSWSDIGSGWREHYQQLAQAIIDSLKLTEEWQVSRKTWHRGVSGKKVNHVDHIGPTTEEHAAKMAANLDGACIESRLVSPWVRSESADA